MTFGQEYKNNVDYTLLDRGRALQVLAVEDDVLSMNFLESQITDLGHTMLSATNGREALDVLQTKCDEVEVVLMDREMPEMDGLTAVKRMKDNPETKNIPVIMVTGADSTEEMKEGLDAGVFYYLTKPVNEDMLRSVLTAAVREAQQSRTLAEELGRHKASFDLIDTCKFKFKTLSEAESLAAFIANCFPDSERVLPGIGEILVNAIEHGNLNIGYEGKTELLEAGTWRAEIERLQRLPENEKKVAVATIAHKEDGTYVVVEDQGQGFEWKKFMQIDPARAGDSHGRGIAQASTMSFDRLTYNEAGNQAIGFVGFEKQLEW